MSPCLTIVILVLVYIISVPVFLIPPYLEYRGIVGKENITIGGFIDYTNNEWRMYLPIVLIPGFGLTFIPIVCIVGLIVHNIQLFYEKFIKNTKL